MLIPNHPHDERLSALASGDPEATADAALSAHVAECLRCTATVDELRLLRTSLAELPDLRPHRPLRLLPDVAAPAPSPADRLGGWARRFFAPALTAGAAIAMVGLVGTTAPILSGLGVGGASAGASPESDMAFQAGGADGGAGEEPGSLNPAVDSASDGAVIGESAGGAPAAAQPSSREDTADQHQLRSQAEDEPTTAGADDERGAPLGQELPADRSPWPMVLFSGVAVMIAAALLRWILAPRAP